MVMQVTIDDLLRTMSKAKELGATKLSLGDFAVEFAGQMAIQPAPPDDFQRMPSMDEVYEDIRKRQSQFDSMADQKAVAPHEDPSQDIGDQAVLGDVREKAPLV